VLLRFGCDGCYLKRHISPLYFTLHVVLLLWFFCFKLHLRDELTNGQTKRRTASAHQQRPPRSPPSRRVDVAATGRPCQKRADEQTNVQLRERERERVEFNAPPDTISVISEAETNVQTPEIEFGSFSLKMWHLVAIILMIFLIINWPNFVYLLVDPGFLPPPPLNFYEPLRFVPP